MLRFPTLSLPSLAVAALIGSLAVQVMSALPPWPVSLACAGIALVVLPFLRHPGARHACVLLLAGSWAAFHGAVAMDARLSTAREGEDIALTGRVAQLPRTRGADTSFLFVPDAGSTVDGAIRLTWFRSPRPPRACETWQLTVRLRRPRGSVNPGGSDAEKTALQRRIAATGYVRNAPSNRRLSSGRCVDGLRQWIADELDARVGRQDARVLKALAVGDTRGLDAADWDIARATGVSHLIAISGFHVGVAAGGGVMFVRLLYALWPLLALRVPRHVAQALLGLAVAGGYGLLAGLGLPTVRTLLMIAVVVLAGWARRRAGGASLLSLALLAVLLCDPLAVLSAGFWLSFAGVAFLMLCVVRGPTGVRGWLGEMFRAQAAMTMALLPLSLWLFGTASLVGFVANLFAAPLVSFLVVPLTLFGCAVVAFPAIAGPPLGLAAWLMEGLWRVLAAMADWPGSRVAVADGGFVPVVLATIGAAWLFVPRGVPLRGYGALLFLPLALPPRVEVPAGGFRAWILDVGQGLAVVVHTRAHTLVYDTGPAYAGGHDAGSGVVLPAITALGIGPVDRLVVSHGDSDHAGGAASVAARYPAASRVSGEPHRLSFEALACRPGDTWTWDGVLFRFVGPTPSRDAKGNDRSCVLSVEGAAGRLLLTGDIGERAERRFDPGTLRSRLPTVVTIAHHGSRHSSSAAWIGAVSPTLAVASSGWRNRFGHPHPSVIDRYASVGTSVYVTASSGAIAIDAPFDGPPRVVREWRRPSTRYWRE